MKASPRRRAVAPFEGAFRDAIHAYKFAGQSSFLRPFVELLEGLAVPAEMVCWPPTATASLKERGNDTAAELATALAHRLGIGIYRGLRRTRQSEKQASLGREERRLNVKDAFEARDRAALLGKRLLVVDDVITTGATMSECKAALLRGGAASVDCIALASSELKGN